MCAIWQGLMNTSTKKRKPRGSLSKDVILDAAKKLLRENGIESLSIRKIASELNAGPMSIYNHFATKQDIELALVSDFVSRAHASSQPTTDWKDWLNNTFVNIFDASTREPEYLFLMINSSNVSTASISVFEESLACLMEAGFGTKDAILSFHKLLSFTLGAAMLKNNLSKFPSSSNVDTENQTLWEDAREVMMGSKFDESLQELIATLNVKDV